LPADVSSQSAEHSHWLSHLRYPKAELQLFEQTLLMEEHSLQTFLKLTNAWWCTHSTFRLTGLNFNPWTNS